MGRVVAASVVASFLLLTLLCPTESIHLGVIDQFLKFIDDFKKPYQNGTDEFHHRLNIFQSNLKRADRLNRAYGKEAAVYGVTKFSDLSDDEFKEQYLSDFRDHRPVRTFPLKFTPEKKLLTSSGTYNGFKLNPSLPNKIDWRDSGAVSPVKNQGQCGACWAFAAAELIESTYTILHNSTEVPQLAVQQLIDCAKSKEGLNNGCEGGSICDALKYVVQDGITYNSNYPLLDKDGMCRPVPVDNTIRISTYTCQGYVGAEDNMLTLLTQGPVAAAVDATTWNNYVGGIIRFHCGGSVNHAVDIVGYDLTGPVPYYIVRNSWGTQFGLNGYLYIEIRKNMCDIAEQVSTVKVIS